MRSFLLVTGAKGWVIFQEEIGSVKRFFGGRIM